MPLAPHMSTNTLIPFDQLTHGPCHRCSKTTLQSAGHVLRICKLGSLVVIWRLEGVHTPQQSSSRSLGCCSIQLGPAPAQRSTQVGLPIPQQKQDF
jgi:hypothetical protein